MFKILVGTDGRELRRGGALEDAAKAGLSWTIVPQAQSRLLIAIISFLASIGEERKGMQLSVLSALARMNVDPREEAARLAAMPRTYLKIA